MQSRLSAAVSSSAGAITGYAGKCVDDNKQSTSSGTPIDIFDCNGGTNQQWTLNSSGELVNTLSGLCLNDSGNGGKGTGLIQSTCDGSSGEIWTYNSSDQYVLTSNGLCLNDPGNVTTNNTQLIIWTCGGFTDEQWSQPGGTPPPLPTGAITGYGGKCVDDLGQSKSLSAPIGLYDCVGSQTQTNQEWTLNSSGELVNTYSGLCLNDSGYGGSGTKMIQYTCSTADSNETWVYDSSGHYVLPYNGLCLNDPGDSTANGTQLIIYACGNFPNENWSPPGTPSVPADMTFSPARSGNAESLTPTFSASYSDTTGSQGYDQFQVLDASGAVVASGTGSPNPVSSGSTSTWTPSTPLQSGGSYKVQARAYFGGYSTWSAATSFTAEPRMADGVKPWSTYIKEPLDKWTTARANVASGGLQVTSSILSLPGAQLPFHLDFWYNSPAAGASSDPGTIAPGWTDSLSARLAQNGDGSVTYYEPDGATGTFTPNGTSGGFNTPGGINATLATASSGGWTLTWHSADSTKGEPAHAQGEADTFNASGQLTKQAAASGEAITITYTSGQPTSVTDTEGRVINLTYNTSGDLTQVNDTASNRTWPVGYDTSGHLNSITDPASGVTKFTTNSSGDVTAISSPDSTSSSNHTVSVGYNSSGQVSTLTQMGTGAGGATNPQQGFTYGNGTTTVKDPDGNNTTYTWDNADRVTQVTDALGQNKSTSWTPDNNIASTKDNQNNVTSFTWDPTTDVLNKVTVPTGANSSYTYGDSSNPYVPTKVTDAQQNVLTYSYDPNHWGLVTQATDQLTAQNTTTYAYQGVGNTTCGAKPGQLCSVTNPGANQTQYSYNASGQVTSIIPPSPLGNTSISSYDGDGNPLQVTTPRGTTTYTWNQNGEMIKAHPADASNSSTPQWNYDGDGNLTKRSSNVSQSFTWDALGRLATSTDTTGAATTYGYDNSGNLTSIQDPAGTTTYTPDAVNKPSKIADPWGGTSTLSYVSGNDTELAKIAFPNGVSESFSYDNSGRSTGMNATTASGTLISETGSYKNSSGADTGLLQSETDTAGDTTSYGYDVVDRLTSATTKSTAGSTVSSYGYGYNGTGDMTSQTINGTQTTYTYNAADELTSQGASYNGAGDLTGGAGFSALGYDAAGQTTSVTPSGGTAASLSYAGYSQNQLYSAGGTTIEPTAIGIAATITGGLTTGYAYTPSGGLLAEHTNGSTYYYLLDPFGGSVLGLTDSSGNLANQYTYSPYGQQTAVKSTVPNLFGYDGGLQAPGTSLIHYGARWYNPALGQWTQQDPSGQNPGYVYAGDNPVNYSDPTGQDGWLDAITGVLVVGGFALAAVAMVATIPILVGVGLVIAMAGVGIYIYQMECKYGGVGSMWVWSLPGGENQCQVFG